MVLVQIEFDVMRFERIELDYRGYVCLSVKVSLGQSHSASRCFLTGLQTHANRINSMSAPDWRTISWTFTRKMSSVYCDVIDTQPAPSCIGPIE